jgi:hypothetical protein
VGVDDRDHHRDRVPLPLKYHFHLQQILPDADDRDHLHVGVGDHVPRRELCRDRHREDAGDHDRLHADVDGREPPYLLWISIYYLIDYYMNLQQTDN